MAQKVFLYSFFGKVFPERANVNIHQFKIMMKNLKGEKIGDMISFIGASQISALITCKKKIDDIYTIKIAVEDAIRIQIDVLGYTNSCGYDIEITQMIDSAGNSLIFGVNIENTELFPNKRPKKFNEIMPLFANEKGDYLRLCLSDLREAIRSPKDTGFFCYRSIECLKQYFVDQNKLDKKDLVTAWNTFRSELDVDRQKIDYIKEFADPVRHGGKKPYSGVEGKKMLEITWEIIDKYILYACNGYKKIN